MLDNFEHKQEITKPNLSPKVTKWVLLFAACSSIIISSDKDSFWENIDISKKDLDPQAELFYNTLKNEMSFSINWFIKSIQLQSPDLFLSDKLQKHERQILLASMWNIKKKKFYFPYNLSKENIVDIKWIIPDLTYLLDSMYWDWYSSILNDWKDHSDKELIFDIKTEKMTYILRRLSIENIEKKD